MYEHFLPPYFEFWGHFCPCSHSFQTHSTNGLWVCCWVQYSFNCFIFSLVLILKCATQTVQIRLKSSVSLLQIHFSHFSLTMGSFRRQPAGSAFLQSITAVFILSSCHALSPTILHASSKLNTCATYYRDN